MKIKKWLIPVVAVLLLVGVSNCSNDHTISDTPAPAPQVQEQPAEAPAHIEEPAPEPPKPDEKAVAFKAKVIETIDAKNSYETIGGLRVEIDETTGSPPTVYLGFNDLTAWANSSEIEKKEYINQLGLLVKSLAFQVGYSQDTAVIVRLMSPSNLELAEYTVWGNAKVYK